MHTLDNISIRSKVIGAFALVLAVTGVHGALIRRLAAEVRALRDEMKREPPGAPAR